MSDAPVAGGARPDGKPLHIALVAGEHSGDQLGFKLMAALKDELGGQVTFTGVGGERMTGEGLSSFFPLSDIAVMGFLPVLRRLPHILRRIRETADRIVASGPDLLVIIDSPDFTHRVARRVRRARPEIPIVDYVSPSVWAWRPGRAPAMRRYVDHLLALLPFEPTAHARLGGPPCSYVGHPLIERLAELRPGPSERARRAAAPPVVLVLPGSRRTEIARLSADFGVALERTVAQVGAVDLVLPAVEHLLPDIEQQVRSWTVKPRILRGEAAKLAAFRQARAALAASGTVTLELALAGVPTVVAYRVAKLETLLRFVIKVPSIVLPNLVLGRNAIPEFIQDACTPEALADALVPLIGDTHQRADQLAAMATLDETMRLEPGDVPSRRAARIALGLLGRPRLPR